MAPYAKVYQIRGLANSWELAAIDANMHKAGLRWPSHVMHREPVASEKFFELRSTKSMGRPKKSWEEIITARIDFTPSVHLIRDMTQTLSDHSYPILTCT